MSVTLVGERQYRVSETIDKHIFIDESDNEFKVDFSFSKDKEKNKEADDGLRIFFTEILT